MSSAVILQNDSAFGPGKIIPAFRDFGIPTIVRRLDRGDEVPQDLDAIRVLIVLGGRLRVADAEGDKFPFLAKEIALLKRLVQHDRPTLGIGLGAQLLAAAAGAKVYPNVKMAPPAKPGEPPRPVEPVEPLPEYGWGPVTFPFPGGTEPIVMGMIDGAPMFHWHADAFDLPRLPPPANPPPPPAPPPPTGNSLLSSTRTCRNQAFRFKNRLFGFQYHFEFTESDIDAILTSGKEELAKIGPDAEAKTREATAKNFSRYRRLGDRVITNFVEFLKVY
jgi:GMP synthase (glutamine-hydrolysing)